MKDHLRIKQKFINTVIKHTTMHLGSLYDENSLYYHAIINESTIYQRVLSTRDDLCGVQLTFEEKHYVVRMILYNLTEKFGELELRSDY